MEVLPNMEIIKGIVLKRKSKNFVEILGDQSDDVTEEPKREKIDFLKEEEVNQMNEILTNSFRIKIENLPHYFSLPQIKKFLNR